MPYNYSKYAFYREDKDRNLKKEQSLEAENKDYLWYERRCGLAVGNAEKRNSYVRFFMLSDGYSFDDTCLTGPEKENERGEYRKKAGIFLSDLDGEAYYNYMDPDTRDLPKRTDRTKQLADMLAAAGKKLLETALPDVDFSDLSQLEEHRERFELLRQLLQDYGTLAKDEAKARMEEQTPELKDLYQQAGKAGKFLTLLCDATQGKEKDPEKLAAIRYAFSEMGEELRGKSLADCLNGNTFSKIALTMEAAEGIVIDGYEQELPHPFTLSKEDREKQQKSLKEQQENLEKKIDTAQRKLERYQKSIERRDGLGAEGIAADAEKIHIVDQRLRRMKQQERFTKGRLTLLENTEAAERAVEGKAAPVGLTTDAVFSPQLKAAIKNLNVAMTAANDAAHAVAAKKGVQQGQMDLRDFNEMVGVDAWTSEEKARELAEAYAEDYLDGAPGLRKARLDEFYDRIDSVDINALDLSCLMGSDRGKRREPGLLTDSERDVLKLISLVRANQTISTKAKENPGYLEARYPTKEARLRYELTQNLVTTFGFNNFLTMGVLSNNGINQGLKEMEGQLPVMSETAMAAQIALQAYRQNMATLLGKEADPSIKFTVPEKFAETLYEYAKPEQPGEVRRPDGYYFDCTVGAILKSSVTKSYMEENGLELEDMIFIDGQSLREKFGAECEGLASADRTKRMKHEAARAMFGGEHRVELATVQTNPHGTYSIQVAAVQPDLHALDELEKANEYSQTRRAFSFGLTKIETRADRADKLWKNDPDRETRQVGIRDTMVKRINHMINIRELDKELKEAEKEMKQPMEYAELVKEERLQKEKDHPEKVRAAKVREKKTQKVKEPMKAAAEKRELSNK